MFDGGAAEGFFVGTDEGEAVEFGTFVPRFTTDALMGSG
jgi:hypothetical protein